MLSYHTILENDFEKAILVRFEAKTGRLVLPCLEVGASRAIAD
jgi:hypothetical protein